MLQVPYAFRPTIGRALVSVLFGACLWCVSLRAQVGDRSNLDQSKPPAHWKIPAAPVRTPAESMQLFDVPDGFRVELVAAEPLVQDPVAIHFDERGRLWVLEWPNYNKLLRGVIPGLENFTPPQSRVVILEDLDADGRMDRRTIFMDGIEWLRGLQLDRDGALVLALPRIVAARDTDGDGRADHEKVVVDGLESPVNPHAAQSNLLRAMDNWIYGSRFPRRLRADGENWISAPHLNMRGQWGFSQDNYGRFFYASNGDHLRGDLVPGHYYTRNPHHTGRDGIDLRLPRDQAIWPHAVTAGTNRRNQLRDTDGTLQVFSANTGPAVYRGDQFPPEFVGNVFLGDVAGRLVRRSILTEKDGLITAENAYQRREFLFSHDERFRPVYTANGPDGALYVADMYRGIIEGHLFVTSYLREQIIARELQTPSHGLGRIYRIVHRDHSSAAKPLFTPADPVAWVAHLAHPNGFWRDTAQRLLVAHGDKAAVPALRKMAREHSGELARIHALWTLEGLAAIEPDILDPALTDASFRVRITAVRLAEPWLGKNRVLRDRVLARADDERIEVRRQLLFSLGEIRDGAGDAAMLRVLQRDASQPIMVDAALSGWHGREPAILAAILGDATWDAESPRTSRLLGALARAVLNSGNDPDIVRLVDYIADTTQSRALRMALLDGMVAGKNRGLSRLENALSKLASASDESLRQRAAELRLTWLMPVSPVAPKTDAFAGPVFEKGRNIFALCSACHGPDGKGLPTIAPALTESAIVAGPPEEFIRTVLRGRNQDRRNPAFPDMPPLAGLRDDEIAAVISYVRARWAGHMRPITAANVAKIRAAEALPASADRP